MQCTCSWAFKFGLNKTKQYLCIMVPAPLFHSFTEGYVNKVGSLNTIKANLPISPCTTASIQVYQATISAKSMFYLPPDYVLIVVPTHRHTWVYSICSEEVKEVWFFALLTWYMSTNHLFPLIWPILSSQFTLQEHVIHWEWSLLNRSTKLWHMQTVVANNFKLNDQPIDLIVLTQCQWLLSLLLHCPLMLGLFSLPTSLPAPQGIMS